MKRISWLYLLWILAIALAGCGPSSPTTQPTQVEQLLTSTITLRNSTPTPGTTPTLPGIVDQFPSPSATLAFSTPNSTISPMRIDTLEPEKANETIKALLREPIDCAAPCFWGIVTGKTSLDEAREIFSHFGLQMASGTFDGNNFSSIGYDSGNGLSFRVILALHNNIVENLQIKMNVVKQEGENVREWSAYSPEILIKRYGIPSRVDFYADWGPGPYFSMQMYFDALDLIVQYSGRVIPPNKGSSQVCPLTADFDSVWLWMGKNPKDPPGPGILLEKATSLTNEEFAKLMTGDPKQACFIFNGNVFP